MMSFVSDCLRYYHVIASDGTVTVDEDELYRALAATPDCPMPAFGLAA